MVSFRNLGQTAIILPGIYDIVGVTAGPTLQETRLQVFGTRPLDTELPTEINNPVDSYYKFLVVPAGESVDGVALQVAEFVVYDPSRKRQPDLRGKNLTLQLELGMQWLSPRLERDLGIRWKTFGYLWNLRFRTEPFELEIPAAPEIADCSHEFRID
jgi:hypothetical protein